MHATRHVAPAPSESKALPEGWFPLIAAVDRENGAAVDKLLKAGDDVNQAVEKSSKHPTLGKDRWPGSTPLLHAARLGNRPIVEMLLARESIDVDKANVQGGTPVFAAAAAGHLEVVRLLADKGANLDLATTRWWKITKQLIRARGGGMTPLFVATANGYLEVVRLLADRGAALDLANKNGWTPISVASHFGHLEIVRFLADKGARLDSADQAGNTPLHAAAQGGKLEVVRLLVERGAPLDPANGKGCTPVFVAAEHHHPAVVAELLSRSADPNKKSKKGLTPLHVAHRGHDAELVATLLVHGADGTAVFGPALAASMVGDAAQASALLLERKPWFRFFAKRRPLVPAIHAVALRGDAAALAVALAASKPGDAVSLVDNAGLPALYYALELGRADLVPLLVTDERVVAAAVEALAGEDGTVPGARYARFTLALVSAGLTEDATTHEAKNLVAKHIGTVAAAVYFDKVPAAFSALKAACTARLDAIARPLEAIYADEGLGEVLGGIGAEWQDLPVRLDDEGLLPVPKHFSWPPQGPDTDIYEDHIMWVIWAVSMALNDGFVAKLRTALARFGSRVSVTPAPVKSRTRMRNKLADADDHALKRRPRPMHNVDTIRAGVVVDDAALMGEVFDAIGAEVGPWLRVKNNYRPAFDATASYGYRALLANLRYESGMTCGELFRDNWDAWQKLSESLAARGDQHGLHWALLIVRGHILPGDNYTRDMVDKPVNIAAEVQLIYKPYLALGRAKSHLHYKVVRCAAPGELVRDAATKYKPSPKMAAAEKGIRGLAYS